MIPDHLHWHARPMDTWWYAVYAANEKKRKEEVKKERVEGEEDEVSEKVGKDVVEGVGEVVRRFLEKICLSGEGWKVGIIESSSSASSSSPNSLISSLFSSKEVIIGVGAVYPTWCTLSIQTNSTNTNPSTLSIVLVPTSPLLLPLSPSSSPPAPPLPSVVSPAVVPREFDSKEKGTLIGNQGKKHSFLSPFQLSGSL